MIGTWASESQNHNFPYKSQRTGKGNSVQRPCVPRVLRIISLPVSVALPFRKRDAASSEKKSFPNAFSILQQLVTIHIHSERGPEFMSAALRREGALCRSRSSGVGVCLGWKTSWVRRCVSLTPSFRLPSSSKPCLKTPLCSFDPARLLPKGIHSNPSPPVWRDVALSQRSFKINK